MIMRDTPPDIMNVLARTILLLYAYDENAEDRSVQHEISTAISLISRLPRIMVLTYYADPRALQQRVHDHASFHPGSVHGGDHSVHAAPRQAVHA